MMTARGKYRFVVKEHGEGQPSIALEPKDGGNAEIMGFLGLDLKPDTTVATAEKVAEFLNASIEGVSITK